MLSTLLIRNLALIETLDLEMNNGLNIITGETGAGKSIMIGAVQLLFGKRADRSLIRTGADFCEISAILDLRDDLLPSVNQLLDDNGVPSCEENQLIIRRQIREQGGRNFVNGAPTTVQILKLLGEVLVDIHGPYDNQSLLKTSHQLQVLDDFTGLNGQLTDCRKRYDEWRALKDKLAAAEQESPSPELIDYLNFQMKEIDDAALQAGEEEELTARHEVASHSHQILQILDKSQELLSGDEDSATDLLGDALRGLMEVARIDAEKGKQFCQALESAIAIIQDLDGEISDYAGKVEIDPDDFTRMEDRLGDLRRVKRKYGGTVESALSHADDCRERLRKLEHFDEYRAEIEAEIAVSEEKLRDQATKISAKRNSAANKLGPQITKKLKLLGFPDCRFSIGLEPGELKPWGFDQVEFYFAPNPGEGNRPLRDIASSGEIARVMLALKTVLAQADRVPVLIFDEVDSNIGGVVANRVGEELRRLGNGRQVICITHQPQVAAGAHCHYVVKKTTKKKRTTTQIVPLSEAERVKELARMLGGE
ncbi:DNA repair protein RecN, partial [bacterium M21]